MQDIYIGRQPIFDGTLKLAAYELLFRSGKQNQAGSFDGDQATSQVLVNAFIEIGLDSLVGKAAAFINVTRNLLLSPDTLPFPQDRVVLEILENVDPDEDALAAVRALHEKGHRIALDDFVLTDAWRAFLPYAHIIKVDIMAMSPQELERQVAELRKYKLKLLAEKIETQDEFEFCKSLGFDYFQGYFLSKPNVVQGREIPPNRLQTLQLVAELRNPEASAKQVEELISRDVGLSYKLLRYINSAFFALPREVESIRQAVVYLGNDAIKTWTTLLMVAGASDKPTILFTNAMLRARMCELLARADNNGSPESFFTVGLFSSLESLLDAPLEKLLEPLPLSAETRSALLQHAGPMGAALKCTLAFERGQWEHAGYAKLAPAELTGAYIEALKWADETSRSLAA